MTYGACILFFLKNAVLEGGPCNTILNDIAPVSLTEFAWEPLLLRIARFQRHQPIPSILDQNVSQMGILRDPAVFQEWRWQMLLRDSEQFLLICHSSTETQALCWAPGLMFLPLDPKTGSKGASLGTQ